MRDFGVKPKYGDAISSYVAQYTSVKNAISKLRWIFCPDEQPPSDIGPDCQDEYMREVYRSISNEHQDPPATIFYEALLRGSFNTMFAPIQQSLNAVSRSRGLMTAIDMALKINNQIASPYITSKLQCVVIDLLKSVIFDVCDTAGVVAAIDMVVRVDAKTTSLQHPRDVLPSIVVKLMGRINPDDDASILAVEKYIAVMPCADRYGVAVPNMLVIMPL